GFPGISAGRANPAGAARATAARVALTIEGFPAGSPMTQQTTTPSAPTRAPRLVGLPESTLPRILAAMQALQRGDGETALQQAGDVLAAAPEHPEALRLAGIAHALGGRHEQARDTLQRSLDRRPDDALVLIDLGNAQQRCGDREGARASWRRAAGLAPGHPMPSYNLGRSLQLEGRTDDAIELLLLATGLAPDFIPARILLADALVHAGRLDEADTQYREVLWRNPASGDAWRGLANLKTRPLSDEDREQLALNHDRADIGEPDRVAMGYALGKACEDHGRHAEALAALQSANARLRRASPWDATGFAARGDALIAATAQQPAPV